MRLNTQFFVYSQLVLYVFGPLKLIIVRQMLNDKKSSFKISHPALLTNEAQNHPPSYVFQSNWGVWQQMYMKWLIQIYSLKLCLFLLCHIFLNFIFESYISHSDLRFLINFIGAIFLNSWNLRDVDCANANVKPNKLALLNCKLFMLQFY